jgi:hypothetical protein
MIRKTLKYEGIHYRRSNTTTGCNQESGATVSGSKMGHRMFTIWLEAVPQIYPPFFFLHSYTAVLHYSSYSQSGLFSKVLLTNKKKSKLDKVVPWVSSILCKPSNPLRSVACTRAGTSFSPCRRYGLITSMDYTLHSKLPKHLAKKKPRNIAGRR